MILYTYVSYYGDKNISMGSVYVILLLTKRDLDSDSKRLKILEHPRVVDFMSKHQNIIKVELKFPENCLKFKYQHQRSSECSLFRNDS